jgi:hypothetical protein
MRKEMKTCLYGVVLFAITSGILVGPVREMLMTLK